MGQIQNVVIIIVITVLLGIVTSGLAYLFDLYLYPLFIIITTYLDLLEFEETFSNDLSI